MARGVFRRAGPRGAAALRNLGWLTADKAVSVVLGFLVFGLIARHLGPAGAGQFSYGVAMLQAALGLSLVCSSAAVLPRLCRLADGPAASAVSNVFAVRLVGSVLAAVAVGAYAALAIDDPARRAVTLVMVATVPLLEPFNAISAYWLSRNRNRVPVLARGGGLVARLAWVGVALWLGLDPWLIALAWAAEALVTATLQSASLRAVRPWRALRAAVSAQRARLYFRFSVRFAVGLWLSHLFLRLDRVWLAERLDPHTFGLYAAAMQLVEVWLQVAILLVGSMAPAFLYRLVREAPDWRRHGRTVAGLAGLGAAGLGAVAVTGDDILQMVFGEPFGASHRVLVAGFAAAVLFFVDQFVQVILTANDRPGLLALKWGTACGTALATLALGTPHLGVYAGPLGLALGIVAGWAALGLAAARARLSTALPAAC